ncbi:MAG: murein transglycosylase, partial [bacterium]|nr:murein transglycosylase [bacterium]
MKAAAPPVLTDSRDVKLLVRAVDYSLSYFKKIDAQKVFRYGPDQFTAQQVRLSLEDFRDKLLKHGLTETFFNYIQENFRFYRSAAEEVLFTGYYEARLQGSLTKKGAYQFPLYKKPGDLVRIDLSSFDIYKKYKGLPRVLKGRLTKNNKVLPYYNRDDIDVKKKLDGKKL